MLTAAHCLQDRSIFSSGLQVVAGLHSQRNRNKERVQVRQAAKIVNHPQYSEQTNQNDIAIIRLSSPVQLNNYVSIARK